MVLRGLRAATMNGATAVCEALPPTSSDRMVVQLQDGTQRRVRPENVILRADEAQEKDWSVLAWWIRDATFASHWTPLLARSRHPPAISTTLR